MTNKSEEKIINYLYELKADVYDKEHIIKKGIIKFKLDDTTMRFIYDKWRRKYINSRKVNK